MAKNQVTRHAKPKRSQSEAQEIEELELRLQELDPDAASAKQGQGQNEKSAAALWNFEDLPLSRYTKEGLKAAKYSRMTAIQKSALPHTLTGKDVLGAAKTGSGKTLAFIIPVVEKLYRLKWGKLDGLGALIISPTRELAMQIFEELRKVGLKHDLSAGLLIGGKNVKEEQDRVNGMNILVATPGRLLQHMDETPGFDCSGLQLLVLDEADRILDMGFSATVNAILENVPARRQTMLFSATQTKSVKDLARLSLHDPTYIAVHREAVAPTPLKLQQAYVICELPNKMNILWAFIKSHLKAKVLVFLSTCKQVKYVYEMLRRLRPGVPLRCIHGKMKQMKRMAVFQDFCEAKGGAVLFATDIAARGLDFPSLDWVVQVDCPEDVACYIHRVGRTARYVSGGRSLLMLLPSEKEAMLRQLEEVKIPIKPLKINPNKTQPIGPALQALLSKSNELKELAQRALVSYMRSVFLQPNRAVFNVASLPAADYAASLGLASAPRLRFLKRTQTAGSKCDGAPGAGGTGRPGANASRSAGDDDVDSGDESSGEDSDEDAGEETGDAAAEARRGSGAAAGISGAGGLRTGASGKHQVRRERSGSEDEPAGESGPSDGGGDGEKGSGDGSDDDGFLVVTRRNIHDVELAPEPAEDTALPGAAKNTKKKRMKIKVGATTGSRVVFDEDGQAVQPLARLAMAEGEAGQEGEEHLTPEERFARARKELRARDAADHAAYRERRRQKEQARKERARARAANEAAVGGGGGVRLAAASDDEAYESGDKVGRDSPHDEESDEDEYGAASEGTGMESDENNRNQRRFRKRGRAPAAEQAPSSKRLAPEPAHRGMAKVAADGAGAGKSAMEGLSIAEQEALALRMLSRRR